jgi:hypothetical protein
MSTTTVKVFQETISVSKSFDVSEGWEATEDANFKTVTFTGSKFNKFKFTAKVDENSTERLIYSSKDRTLVLECEEEERFLELRENILFALLNF